MFEIVEVETWYDVWVTTNNKAYGSRTVWHRMLILTWGISYKRLRLHHQIQVKYNLIKPCINNTCSTVVQQWTANYKPARTQFIGKILGTPWRSLELKKRFEWELKCLPEPNQRIVAFDSSAQEYHVLDKWESTRTTFGPSSPKGNGPSSWLPRATYMCKWSYQICEDEENVIIKNSKHLPATRVFWIMFHVSN